MWFSSALALAGGLVSVSISPTFAHPQFSYVVHEKRDSLPHSWKFESPANPSTILLTKIGLVQPNLAKGHDHLLAVSDPQSPTYGQHWTATKVAEFFQPSAEIINAVQAWILFFDVTVEKLQNLLQTKYSVYQHQSGQVYISSESYKIPASLKDYIYFITLTVQFDVAVKITNQAKQDTSNKAVSQPSPKIGGPIHPDLSSDQNISNCDDQITPDCLRAIVEFQKGNSMIQKNSYGIVEFAGNSYSQADLDLFLETYTEVPSGTSPVYLPIDGGYLAPGNDSATLGESNLNLQFAIALVYPQPVSMYQTGDDVLFQPATNNNFLDAVDVSYCTYDGGDNPT
ncbi:hypothetical protein B7463_g1647, partial [Scytalidium lignicola]